MDNREHVTTPTPSSGEDAAIVLIVDDEQAIAEAIALLVEGVGYSSMLANNGQQALELAQAQWPGLVLTDMMMPILGGAGLIKALRAEAEATHRVMPPVILLTAGGMAEARSLGADAVLRKPFDIYVLEQLIVKLLSW